VACDGPTWPGWTGLHPSRFPPVRPQLVADVIVTVETGVGPRLRRVD